MATKMSVKVNNCTEFWRCKLLSTAKKSDAYTSTRINSCRATYSMSDVKYRAIAYSVKAVTAQQIGGHSSCGRALSQKRAPQRSITPSVSPWMIRNAGGGTPPHANRPQNQDGKRQSQNDFPHPLFL